MSINTVAISGNLTRDPEIRTTQSGTSILNLGIAVNDRRRNPQTGEWEDVPNFVDCTLFGNRAEWLSRDLHKGKKVFVQGKLRYSSWERDGQKRSKLEVVIDEIDYERPPRSDLQPTSAPQMPQAANYPTQVQSAPQSVPQQAYYNQAPMQQSVQQPAQPVQQNDLWDEDVPF